MKKMKKLMLGSIAVGGLAAVAFATRRKDTVSVVLKENLINGYLWMYEIETKGVIEEYSTNYSPSPNPNNDTAFGKHRWTFAPVKKGETLVKFSYAKPWDSNEPAAAAAVYKFTVDDSHKLSAELMETSGCFDEFVVSLG